MAVGRHVQQTGRPASGWLMGHHRVAAPQVNGQGATLGIRCIHGQGESSSST